jgi:hypothetical protein
MLALHAVTFASVVVPSASALAQTSVWDNEKGDYAWFEAMNWNPDGVPTMSSDVTAAADDVIVALSQPIDVKSIMSTGPGLRLTGGSGLRVSASSEVSGLIIDTCCATNIVADGPLKLLGMSRFNQLAVFSGSNTVDLGGQPLFNVGLIADTQVDVSGTATVGPGDPAFARTGRVFVDGTLNLLSGARLTSSSLTPGSWIVNGTMTIDGTGITNARAFIPAEISTASGSTVRAKDAGLEFSGAYSASGTYIAEGAGEIDFTGTEGVVANPVFRGDGVVRINGPAEIFSALNEMTGPTGLVLAGNNLSIDPILSTAGTLSIGNATMIGGGSIQIIGGVTKTVANVPRSVSIGLVDGRLEIAHALEFTGVLCVDGGVLDLQPGAALGSPSDGGPVVVNGGAIAMAPDLPAGTVVDIFADLVVRGGVFLIEGGQLRLREGSKWFGGEVTFGTTDAGVLFIGGLDEHVFFTGVGFSGRGLLALGGTTSFDRPDIRLDDDLTVEIGGADDRDVGTLVRTRVYGPGQLVNTGYLEFGGVPRVQCRLTSDGLIVNTNSVTLESTVINAGAWEQEGSVRLIGAAVINTGLWTVEGTGRNIQDAGLTSTFTNSGVYTVTGAAGFIGHTIGTLLSNPGVLAVTNAEVTITASTDLDDNGRLTGGNWTCGANGRIRFPGGVAEVSGPQTIVRGTSSQLPETRNTSRLTDRATREITGDSTLTPTEGRVTVDDATLRADGGTTTVPEVELKNGGSLDVAPDARVESAGPVRVGEPPSDPANPTVLDAIQGTISLARPAVGDAPAATDPTPPTVAASVIELHGRLVPGGDRDTGPLRLEAPVTAFESATWAFDVAGPDDADRVEVTGPVAIAGTLRVSQHAPLSPGDVFTLVEAAAGLSGNFDAVVIDQPQGAAAVARLAVVVDPAAVRLIATCPADFAVPLGQLTFADIGAFLASFNAGTPDVDLAEPFGQLTFADISAFLVSFNAGCP